MVIVWIVFAGLTVQSCLAATPTQAERSKVDEKPKLTSVPKLAVDKPSIKQGEFFVVIVSEVSGKPTVWFNSRAYESFKLDENKYRALIPVENMTKPGAYSILAKTSSWEQKIPVAVADNGKGVQKITLSGDKVLTATKEEVSSVGRGLRTLSQNKLWSGKFTYPNKAEKSSPFGVKRSYNGGPVDSYHKGLDFAASMGDPVFAPEDGNIMVTGEEKKGFVVHGNTVIMDHGQGVTSIYMHLSKIDVKKGDFVKKGTKIGEVGHTGVSTGPHLHWGVYVHGVSVDPELFVGNSVP